MVFLSTSSSLSDHRLTGEIIARLTWSILGKELRLYNSSRTRSGAVFTN